LLKIKYTEKTVRDRADEAHCIVGKEAHCIAGKEAHCIAGKEALP